MKSFFYEKEMWCESKDLIEYLTAWFNNPETSARMRIEKPKALAKAIETAEMIRRNTSLISKT